MKFLSLGAGVQSTTLLMMSIKGEIERPDHVIFADTGFEQRSVYKHLHWCEKQCEKAGLPLHIVKAKKDMREQFHEMENGDRYNWNSRPAFYMDSGKSRGVSLRQCTRDSKIIPINKKQLELAGHKTARTCGDGELIVMIGMSTDESRRASQSKYRWIDRIYPLIDPLRMSRSDCISWWENNYPHINLPSSSCTICPYHSDQQWLRMKENQPDDWAEAVEYDERIRYIYRNANNSKGDREPQDVYLHRSYKPLKDIDLNQAQITIDLEDDIYCAGGCGL